MAAESMLLYIFEGRFAGLWLRNRLALSQFELGARARRGGGRGRSGYGRLDRGLRHPTLNVFEPVFVHNPCGLAGPISVG